MIRLREFRTSKGLTQTDLSKAADVPQSVISDIESGTSKNPTVLVMAKLAQVLGVSVEDLLGEEAPNTA